ncbi:MAG: hypothetical protein OXT67_10030 [Zetaproteobacteria bacterium]|nr:hypothetical protein [Zetaproteobacteria bacterium]
MKHQPIAKLSIPNRCPFLGSREEFMGLRGAEIAARVLHKHLERNPDAEAHLSQCYVAKGAYSVYSNDYAREVLRYAGLSKHLRTANFGGGALSAATALQHSLLGFVRDPLAQTLLIGVEASSESPLLGVLDAQKAMHKISTAKSVAAKMSLFKNLRASIWKQSKGGFQSVRSLKRLGRELQELATQTASSPLQLRQTVLTSQRNWKNSRVILEKQRSLVPIYSTKAGKVSALHADEVTSVLGEQQHVEYHEQVSPRRDGAAAMIVYGPGQEGQRSLGNHLFLVDYANASPSDPAYRWNHVMSAVTALLEKHDLRFADLDVVEVQELSPLHTLSLFTAFSQHFGEHRGYEPSMSLYNPYGGCLAFGFYGAATLFRQFEHIYIALSQKKRGWGLAVVMNPGRESSLFLLHLNQGNLRHGGSSQ